MKTAPRVTLKPKLVAEACNRRYLQLSHGWMMTGGLSLGKTIGWTGGTDLNNPNQTQFGEGVVGNDIPYSVRLSGLYELPFGISASGTF
jgi:hypothetical protein